MEQASNSNSQTASFKLNNFDILLSQNETELTIEAEQENTLKRFSITITPENIKDITTFVFRDLEVMYLDLLEAFEQKAGMKISITDDARIMYSQEREVRGKTVKEGFTLWLDEEKIDDQKKQEKRIDNLLKQVAQLESRVARLEKENGNLTEKNRMMEDLLMQKVQNLEKQVIPGAQKALEGTLMGLIDKHEKILEKSEERLSILEAKIMKENDSGTQILDCRFNPSGNFASNFTLNNNNKTACSKTVGTNTIFSQQPLIRGKKQKFSLQVHEFTGNMGLGISSASNFAINTLYNKTECLMFVDKGNIWVNGTSNHSYKKTFSKGSTVSFVVDMETGEVSISVNDSHAATLNLGQDLLRSKDFYPFLYVEGNNSGATFV